jgi:protein O-mannosyl-transferase
MNGRTSKGEDLRFDEFLEVVNRSMGVDATTSTFSRYDLVGMVRARRERRRPDSSKPRHPRKPQETGRLSLAGAGLIVTLAWLAYSNSFTTPFVYDDAATIRDNVTIRQLWPLSRPLTPPPSANPMSGRPIVNLSLAANYRLGGLNPWGYHAANLAIHVGCAMLLLGITRRTLNLHFSESVSLGIAIVSTAIWAVHSLNSEAVEHISARTESLMAFFYLATFYAAIRAWPSRSRAWSVTCVVACALGMACKETTVTAPLLLVLYDRAFHSETWADTLRARRWLYTGLAATYLVFLWLNAAGPRGHSAGLVSDPGLTAPVSSWTYLFNQARLIPRYLRLAVWPSDLVLDYGTVPTMTLGDVAGRAAVMVVLLIIVSGLWIRKPRWGFLGIWFFVTLAPASSFVPIFTEVGAERRMYLAMMAFILTIVLGTYFVLGEARLRRAPMRMFATAIIVCAIGALITTTRRRNAEYDSPLTLWRTNITRWPHGRAHYNLGMALNAAGYKDEGMAELRQSVSDYPEAGSVLGVQLLDQGRTAEGIDVLERFIRERPDHANVVLAHGRLGDVFFEAGQYANAISEYRAYLAQRPQFIIPWTNLGISLAATGQPAAAVTAFERAVLIEPGNGSAHRNLANALLETGDYRRAEAEAREAIRLTPGDRVAQEILALSMAALR